MARTGFVFRTECMLHDTGPGHPERAARLDAIRNAFVAAGLTPGAIAIEPARRDDLLRVHTADHVALIESTCAADA